MGMMSIVDNSIWFRHLPDDLRAKAENLKAGERILLEIDGVTGWWERMQDGRDGRPSLGLKPVDGMREVWTHWQARRGERVSVNDPVNVERYLAALSGTLEEWDSPEDEAAYADL